jgi:hypothetical protein
MSKKYADAYYSSDMTKFPAMSAMRLLLGVALLAAPLPRSAIAADGPHGAAAMTCTNPASGHKWQLKIDYDHATADTYPASISDAKISWKDASDGGNYTLDRKSGELTAIFASSTGGFFLHHRCMDN